MRWLALIWKSLMRSKRRTLLIVGSVVLSVFTVAVLQSLLTTLNAVTDNPNSSNRLVVRHKSGLTQMLPRSYEPYLRQQPEVETVCALQWFGGYYQDPRNFFANFASDETVLFQTFREEFGVSNITEAQMKDYIRDGAGCIVGESLAKKNGWKVGDVVPLTGTIFPISPRLTIRLIYKSPKPSDENVLHFHYKVLEEGVPYMKGLCGSFWLRAHRPEDIPRLIERVDRRYANSAYETLTETENAFNLSFVKMLGNIGAIIQGITAAVVVAILIVTGNTMTTAIRERTTEIAVFRAMGFSTGRVLALLLSEGVLLVGAGGCLGVLLANLAAGGVRESLGMAMPFFADFAILPDTALVCLAGALAVGLLATFVPAYAATRRPITDGLKAVGLILGLLLLLPIVAYLAWLVWALVAYPIPLSYNLRSLWQRKISSLSTAAAIALVVGIFVVVLSLAQGLSVAFISSGRADQALVLRPNARFELNSSIERDRMRILKVHPLVKREGGEPMVSAECVVVKLFPMADGTDNNVTVRGLERMGISLRPQVRLVQGRWFRPGLSEVVVPRKMQGRFPGMEAGRSLRMGGRDWLIVGAFDAGGASYESEVWSDVNDVMQAFKREAYSVMLARLENPERVTGFAKAVEDDKRLKLDVVRETDYFKELTKAGDPIKILGNLITLILTGAAIFAAMNTMYAAVAGRTKEIGTLRALGFRQREILASFQWESIFLCLTGGMLGSGLALFANGIQTGTTSFETFSDVSFAFTITPGLMAQGVAFSLVMGLLGGLLPAWRASRIPLTEAMKGG